jgi:xanthine dehydrogenase molybdenum-binding subunit
MVVEAKREFKVIGTRPVRHDGVDKVTGRARYSADVHIPGMLYGKILRSPHAHARIVSIDTSKAEALAGVHAVVTGKDFPIVGDRPIDFGEGQASPRTLAEASMAHDKALFRGHAVAAVAAVDRWTAEEALDLIEVVYEPLPAVLNVRDAMQPDAPLVHERLTHHKKKERFARGEDTGEGNTNVASHQQLKQGDVAQGFAEADVVVEREFTTEAVHQGYLEPPSSTAIWQADGRITIWTSTQSTFNVRTATAAILAVPESSVKIVPMEIGGGFGGKTITYIDPVVATLSRKSGRPVKISLTRKEVFEACGPTSGSYMRAKIGATKDGRITAAEVSLAYEAGAFPGSPVGSGVVTCTGCYTIPNLLIDGYDVVVNRPKTAAYRAPGQPQAFFAVESVIDEIAEQLQIDPLELRFRNAVRDGDRNPTGVPYPAIGYETMLEAMRSHPHYNAPLEGPNKGRGVAVGYRPHQGNRSSVTLAVNADGTVNCVTGAVDIGVSRTTSAMMTAEALGIRAEDVHPSVADTDSIGWTGATAGSRVTYDTGLALYNAAQKVKAEMAKRAALLFEVEPERVTVEDGIFAAETPAGRKQFTFKELAGRLMATGGPVIASATNDNADVGPIFGGNIVDVEVDPETGKVDILRFTAFMDAGTAIHPSYVEGQLQGGTVQAIGWAMSEEYFMGEDGRMQNSSLLDYRMPTALDVPMIDTVLIEVPNPRHPYGVRGVAEIPVVPTPAALANAIHNATGARITHLPMKPGIVMEALSGQ